MVVSGKVETSRLAQHLRACCPRGRPAHGTGGVTRNSPTALREIQNRQGSTYVGCVPVVEPNPHVQWRAMVGIVHRLLLLEISFLREHAARIRTPWGATHRGPLAGPQHLSPLLGSGPDGRCRVSRHALPVQLRCLDEALWLVPLLLFGTRRTKRVQCAAASNWMGGARVCAWAWDCSYSVVTSSHAPGHRAGCRPSCWERRWGSRARMG